MAITNYLVHFKTKDTYDQTVVSNPLRNDAVAFIQDATIIRTHGTDYHCGSGPVALKSELASVATTGSYNDLIDKPENINDVYILDISSISMDFEESSSGVWTGTPYSEIITNIENKDVVLIFKDEINDSYMAIPALVQMTPSGVAFNAVNLFENIALVILSNNTYNISYREIVSLSNTSKINIGDTNLGEALQKSANTNIQLSNFGITATAAELNYVNGVTSNIQTQLDEKASISSLNNYLPLTGGTLTGVLTLKGDSSTGNIIEVDNDDLQSFNIYSADKPINIKANATSLSVSSEGIEIGGNVSELITLNGTGKSQNIKSSRSLSIVCGYTELKIDSSNGNVTLDGSVVLTEDNYQNYITTTDTKNTAGSSDSISKLFLIGASSQSSTGVQTYSNSNIYIQDGNLFLNNGDLNVNTSGTLFGGKLNIRSGIFLVNSEQVTFNPAGSDTFSLFYNDGISLTLEDSNGSFTVNGGVGTFSDKVNAVNGFYETSDARLKNFKDDIKALDIISEIPTKYFTWKKDETDDPKLHIGTSAQEIQKIYPDLVTENEEGELSVDYARLSVIALAAIKELKKEIEELKFIKNGGRED